MAQAGKGGSVGIAAAAIGGGQAPAACDEDAAMSGARARVGAKHARFECGRRRPGQCARTKGITQCVQRLGGGQAEGGRVCEAAANWPWLSALLSPDRWLLWLGVLFVLSVYYFPTGVVGRLRANAAGVRS